MKTKELKKELKKKGIDCMVLFNLGFKRKDPNLFYFLQKNMDFACLVLGKRDFLVVSESEKIKLDIKVEKIPKRKKLFEFLNKKLKNCKTIGLNMNFVSVNLFKTLKKELKNKKFRDISGILNKLRTTKTEEEIKLIKKSCKIADKILNKLIKNFKKFKNPLEASLFLKNETEKSGYKLAFEPIITQNFKEIHPKTSKQKFKKGFCIIDFGVKYKGYCSDVTRTVYIGKPSEKEKEIYNLMLDIQKNLIKNLKTNQGVGVIIERFEKELKKYKKYCSHGLGHGIGVEIHELPSLREDSKERVKEDMIFTIEPGIYFKNIGIRIEDDVLIKKNKAEILTKTKKELIII